MHDQRTDNRVSLVVLHAVLLAEGSHVRLHLGQMRVIDRGEKMVLSLKVQATSEQEHKVAFGGDVASSDYLMFEEVFVELLGGVRG